MAAMSSDSDPDARWRDLRQYGPGADALFARYLAPTLLEGHVAALIKPDGRLGACDAARARRLYDDWIAPLDAGEATGLVDACHDAFIGKLLEYVKQAIAANIDSRSQVNDRDALLSLLREFVALEPRPLGERPDFTRHISAAHSRERSPATHLTAALLHQADYMPDIWPSMGPDPVFEPIRETYFGGGAPGARWDTDEAGRLFQSASYYLVHGGPACRRQILAGLCGGAGHDAAAAAAACRDLLNKTLQKWIWDGRNHGRRTADKREGWTLLNLVYAAARVTRRDGESRDGVSEDGVRMIDSLVMP